MKISLSITLLLLGFSSTPVAESKQPPSPEKIYLVTALAAVATIQSLQFDTTTQFNKVVRGDSFVQFPNGGKIWLCGSMADGTVDASLDVIAEEATATAIVNGADPRNVYVDHRY